MSREEAFRKWYHGNVCSWRDDVPVHLCDCADAPLYSNAWFQEQEPRIWNAALDHAVEVLEGMLAAYPEDVFIPPDHDKAHKALQVVGMTLDGVSADAMRHALLEAAAELKGEHERGT